MQITKIYLFDEKNIKDMEAGSLVWPGEGAQSSVYVWKFSINCKEVLACANQFLSAEEEKQATCYKILKDQAAYRIGHGMLRFLLSCGDRNVARNIEILRGKHGKPYIKAANSFNISHAGDYVVIAFANGFEVGVDVEKIRKHKWKEAMLKKVLHEQEYQEFLAADDFGEEEFFLKWTQKEAVLKAMGDGLTKEMSAFYLCDRKENAICLILDGGKENVTIKGRVYSVFQKKYQEDTSSWQVFSFSFEEGYFLSLAMI